MKILLPEYVSLFFDCLDVLVKLLGVNITPEIIWRIINYLGFWFYSDIYILLRVLVLTVRTRVFMYVE